MKIVNHVSTSFVKCLAMSIGFLHIPYNSMRHFGPPDDLWVILNVDSYDKKQSVKLMIFQSPKSNIVLGGVLSYSRVISPAPLFQQLGSDRLTLYGQWQQILPHPPPQLKKIWVRKKPQLLHRNTPLSPCDLKTTENSPQWWWRNCG